MTIRTQSTAITELLDCSIALARASVRALLTWLDNNGNL
jgi:hypothetical protein